MFDMTPDGPRVLTYVNPMGTGEQSASVHVTFLLNFFDEIRRRLPQ